MRYLALLLVTLLGLGAFVYHTGTFVDAKWVYDTSTDLFKQGHRQLSDHLVDRAAAYGHTPAMYEVGNRYFSRWRNAGDPADSLKGWDWMTRMQALAAQRRTDDDLWILGVFHAHHPWAEQDLHRSAAYLAACAAHDHPWCTYHLSVVQWDMGRYADAFTTAQQGALQGHEKTLAHLSGMYRYAATVAPVNGRTPQDNWTSYLYWLRRAADVGSAGAAQQLRMLERDGLLDGPPVPARSVPVTS